MRSKRVSKRSKDKGAKDKGAKKDKKQKSTVEHPADGALETCEL